MKRTRRNKGLVMVTALAILLTISAVSMMQLHSIITQVGTSRWYRIDALAGSFTMGGANAALGLAVKDPIGFENYLQAHRNPKTGIMSMGQVAISQYFTTIKGDKKSVFAPDTFTTDFQLQTTDPDIINSVPGFAMGKYCMKKYYIRVTGRLIQANADNSHSDYIKHMQGVLMIGPSLCE